MELANTLYHLFLTAIENNQDVIIQTEFGHNLIWSTISVNEIKFTDEFINIVGDDLLYEQRIELSKNAEILCDDFNNEYSIINNDVTYHFIFG